MKTDVEIPERPPKKRRQLEAALDLWLAVWLSRDDLTPSERRRVEEEKARRKQAAPTTLLILKTTAGLTPEQRRYLNDAKDDADEFKIWTSGFGVMPYQERIKSFDADRIIAAPKEMSRPERPEDGSVWAAVRYARHRNIPVMAVMPDGSLLREEEDDG